LPSSCRSLNQWALSKKMVLSHRTTSKDTGSPGATLAAAAASSKGTFSSPEAEMMDGKSTDYFLCWLAAPCGEKRVAVAAKKRFNECVCVVHKFVLLCFFVMESTPYQGTFKHFSKEITISTGAISGRIG
jgi:hypothetical protein